jgi:hypothetical protein
VVVISPLFVSVKLIISSLCHWLLVVVISSLCVLVMMMISSQILRLLVVAATGSLS